MHSGLQSHETTHGHHHHHRSNVHRDGETSTLGAQLSKNRTRIDANNSKTGKYQDGKTEQTPSPPRQHWHSSRHDPGVAAGTFGPQRLWVTKGWALGLAAGDDGSRGSSALAPSADCHQLRSTETSTAKPQTGQHGWDLGCTHTKIKKQ